MNRNFVVTSTFADGECAYLANDANSYLWCEDIGDVCIFNDLGAAVLMADEILLNNGVPNGGRAPVVVEMTVKVVYVAEAA